MANQWIHNFFIYWESFKRLFESVLLQEDILRNKYVEEIKKEDKN